MLIIRILVNIRLTSGGKPARMMENIKVKPRLQVFHLVRAREIAALIHGDKIFSAVFGDECVDFVFDCLEVVGFDFHTAIYIEN